MCLNVECKISVNIRGRLEDVPDTEILNIECEIFANIWGLIDVSDP